MIVSLTTDFGPGSGYPAQMKAVLLERAPHARLVDISHAVPPQDLTAGALLLEACVPVFPPGSVHLAVVDPGVGGARRPIAVAWRGQRFVGPDNGLFEPFLDGAEVRLLAREDLWRKPVSHTFHGRDLFAPAAAFLARGGAFGQLGPIVGDPVRLRWPAIEPIEGGLRAPVLGADSFGNLRTRLRRETLGGRDVTRIRVIRPGEAAREVGPPRRTYADAAPGQLLALWSSAGTLEIAVAQGSAARAIGLAPEAPIWVEVLC